MAAPASTRAGQRFSTLIIWGGVGWSVVAALGILLYIGFDWHRIGLAVFVGFASGAVGALIGFLFGIPRAAAGVLNADGGYEVNTNLEQVSDWLTKIVVGVGLVQFHQIGDAVAGLGRLVGSAIGDVSLGGTTIAGSGTVFAVSLMIVTVIIAFQLMYMWTTTRLYDVFAGRSPETGGPAQPVAGEPATETTT